MIRIGYESDRVVIGRAEILQWRLPVGLSARVRPRVAVEVVQYRSAPVALLGRGYGARKMHAEHRVVGVRKLGDAARTHAVAKTGDRVVIAGQRPEAPRQARNEQEQYERKRKRQCQGAQRQSCRSARGKISATVGGNRDGRTGKNRLGEIKRRALRQLWRCAPWHWRC